MANDIKIMGVVRGTMMDLLATGREDQQPHLTGQGEQLVAAGAAPYQEIVRQGRSFLVNTTTAVATVTAIPTTAHALAIYNNEADGGRSLIIDRVWALFTVNTTAALQHVGIIGCLGLVRETAPTDAALGIKQMNGMGNTDTRVRTQLTGTALPAGTGIAANWFPIGPSINSAIASLPGFQITKEVDGRIIVPPGRFFALHTLGSHTTCSAQVGIEWTEKVILNG
jgi:hypothetical protein